MSCKKCGREDGHWLGCEQGAFFGPMIEPVAIESPQCEAGGCPALAKPYLGRGQRPKYCQAHSKSK